MNKSKKAQFIALICLCLTLVISGVTAGSYLEGRLTGVSVSRTEDLSADEKFYQYLDDLFRQEVTASTINLHYTLRKPENYGIDSYNVTLGEISDDSREASAAALENIQGVLSSVKKKELDLNQQMTYDILEDYVQREMSVTDLWQYQEILRPSTGIQAELPVLMAEYTFYVERDVQDYLALLNQTPDYFSQILAFEQKKAAAGFFMPKYAADDIIAQCRNFIEDPENNYLLGTFNDKLETMDGINDAQKEVYRNQNREAVLNKVVPAYENLIQGMTALAGEGKNQEGLCHLEKGREYYEYLVAAYTGSGMSVEEMKDQTKRQRAEDLTQAQKLISQNPDLLSQCSTYAFSQTEPTLILEDLQEKMAKDFPAPPDTTFTIKYVHPSLEEFMAPAFYLSVPIDDISQNSIYINGSNNYQKMKLYTTLAHEGFPGHLYQNIMERSQQYSPIRSLLGTSGYAEGWATYVEMVSYGYADIDSQLAFLLQKDQSALLSLYATADMGIHYDGWSLKEMKEFFGSYQITDETALTEIYHLIVEEPAHYLKYYIGYLEFMNLKSYAMKTFGEDYSDYKFHEALMDMGPAQFPVLKEYLCEFYNKAGESE